MSAHHLTHVPTPGAYLKARRLVAGLTIADVTARLDTVPHLHEVDRVDWITRIEADAVPACFSTIVALRSVFRFNLDALAVLDQIARGEIGPESASAFCALCGSMPGDIIPAHTTWTDPLICPVCTIFGPVPALAA